MRENATGAKTTLPQRACKKGWEEGKIWGGWWGTAIRRHLNDGGFVRV